MKTVPTTIPADWAAPATPVQLNVAEIMAPQTEREAGVA